MTDEFPPPFGESAIGSQIAGYRLEGQIGRGGMAVVYRAYDPRLDRYVALKILAPGLALDDAFRQRFIRESTAAAALDSRMNRCRNASSSASPGARIFSAT